MTAAHSGPGALSADEPVGSVVRKTAVAQAWLAGTRTVGRPPFEGGSRHTLRVTGHPPETASAVVEVFKPSFRVLEAMSAGRIKVHDSWGAKVHGEREGADALRAGATDMAPCYSPWDPNTFPLAQALSLPGLFPNAELATYVSEAVYADFLRADVERQGLRMGRLKATGQYNLFSKQPITKLEDLNSAKVASSHGPETTVLAALGAIPVALSSLEIKPAFSSGEIDAVSIADSSGQVFGIDQLARFRTALNITRLNLEYCLRREFWEELPRELQLVLNDWLRAQAQAETQIFYGLAGARARAAFKAAGMTFLKLATEEEARWMDRLREIPAAFVARNEAAGRPARRLLGEIEKIKGKNAGRSATELMIDAIDKPIRNINAYC